MCVVYSTESLLRRGLGGIGDFELTFVTVFVWYHPACITRGCEPESACKLSTKETEQLAAGELSSEIVSSSFPQVRGHPILGGADIDNRDEESRSVC